MASLGSHLQGPVAWTREWRPREQTTAGNEAWRRGMLSALLSICLDPRGAGFLHLESSMYGSYTGQQDPSLPALERTVLTGTQYIIGGLRAERTGPCTAVFTHCRGLLLRSSFALLGLVLLRWCQTCWASEGSPDIGQA